MPTHSMNSPSDGTAPNGILDMVHLQKCVRITTLVEVEQYLMVALWTCGVSGRNPLGIVDAKTAIARNRPHVIPLVDEHLSSNVSTYVPSMFSPSSLHASCRSTSSGRTAIGAWGELISNGSKRAQFSRSCP